MDFDLPLGDAGLGLDDISPRLYYENQAVSLAGVTLTPATGSAVDYVLAGLPDDGSYRLTYEYPDGVWAVLRWGGQQAPAAVIIPVREPALTAGDLGLVLLKDGADAGIGLTALELGVPGDYLVRGWPPPAPGERWTLRWDFGGIYGSETWRDPSRSAGTRLDVDDRVMAAFAAAWRSVTPPAALTAMPYVVARGGGYRPLNQQPYVEVDVLLAHGDQSGTPGARVYNLPGVLQVSVYVKDGDGPLLASALLVIAADVLEQIQVQGFKIYGCRKPYDLPAPPAGYYGRAVDAPSRYVGP